MQCGIATNLVRARRPRMAWYAVSKSMNSKQMFPVWKFSHVTKVTGRVIWPSGVEDNPGITLCKGAELGFNLVLGICISSKALAKRILSATTINNSMLQLDIMNHWV